MAAVRYLKSELKKLPGVTDIMDNYILGRKEIRINVRPTEAASAGVSVVEVGNTVRAAFEGIIATTVKKLEEEIDIRVSLSQKERTQGQTLNQLQIPNAAGYLIPLSRIATVTKTQSLADYEHEDYERQIKVLGDVGDNNAEMDAILANTGFPLSFPPAVLKAADKIDTTIRPEEIAKRRDFRKTTTFTIDPHDAKDFDDALSFVFQDDGSYEIGIHIADVSYYVREGDVIDKEAQER